MERFYEDFNFTMDNMVWHYARYNYSQHKVLNEAYKLQNEIEKYYKFNLLTYYEYMQLKLRLQEIVRKKFLYK